MLLHSSATIDYSLYALLLAVPPSTGHNVCRHSLHGLDASMTEQKKNRTSSVELPSFPTIQIQANQRKSEEGDVAHAEDCGRRGGLARAPRKCELHSGCSSGDPVTRPVPML